MTENRTDGGEPPPPLEKSCQCSDATLDRPSQERPDLSNPLDLEPQGIAFGWPGRDVLETFYQCATLRQRDIDRLTAAGVGMPAIAYPDELRRASVAFEPSGHFELVANDGEGAFVVLCRNEFGDPCDLCAWQPSGRVALWLRRAWCLGEDCIREWRLDEPPVLPVGRTPLAWLRSGRAGIVLLRPEVAPVYLPNLGPLGVEDERHAYEIRALFEAQIPTMYAAQAQEAAA